MKGKKNRSILSSTLARIVAFFVLAIGFMVGLGGAVLTFQLIGVEAYTKGGAAMIHDIMSANVWNDVNYVKELYRQGDIKGIENYLDRRNISMEIYNNDVPEGEEILLWSDYDGAETQFSFNCFTEMYVLEEVVPEETEELKETKVSEINETDVELVEEGEVRKEIAQEPIVLSKWQPLLFRVYVDDTFPFDDEYRNTYTWGMALMEWIYVIPVAAIISIILFLSSFIYLMCSAGHHRGQEGISGGVLHFFHFDIITVVFGGVALTGMFFAAELTRYGDDLVTYLFLLGVLTVEVIWGTIYCMEFATELKLRTLFRHTLIYTILHWCKRGMKIMWHGLMSLVRGLPLVMNVLLVYLGFCIVQFFALVLFCELWSMDGDVLILCFLEKMVLLPVVLYFALVCKKLKQGSEALAEGKFTYKLDTSKMILGFKEHGENLNCIGDGIAVAVKERMRSEHLKTELITNVSHDLKTPLTSIINYADLIGTVAEEENVNQEQLSEYAEVLLRQSKRLKKLLEDLVEASKATTGNLEVKLEPCEVSVILSQAVGEYEQRFAEKGLNLIVRQPQEPVSIQADGRHLWRVFDNLLNNICKYAQENSRVYLTVEPSEDKVEIVFRNMSKYPLEISADELQERFVRGDKSRHMEGNGLGLSIAGSLVELQKGKMEIVTDGDLFKVILRFPMLNQ